MTDAAKPIKISGVGIHSGAAANLVIKSSKTPGIWFRRTDLPGAAPILARWDNVGEPGLQNTTIGTAPNCVRTIEHLMAALFVCGVDSAMIEIDGPEAPILDGSARKFMEIFRKARFAGRNARMKRIIVRKEVVARRSEIIRQMPFFRRAAFLLNNFAKGRKSDGYVKLSPNKAGLSISAALDYPDKIIGRQRAEFFFDGSAKARENFAKNFAAARTFGSLHEWEWLKKRGMGRGADESNVIVLNKKGDGVLNKLLWRDEFVRHKIIDALGDMALSGGFIAGRLESFKGSHALNNLVLRKLFADPSNYEAL